MPYKGEDTVLGQTSARSLTGTCLVHGNCSIRNVRALLRLLLAIGVCGGLLMIAGKSCCELWPDDVRY